MIPSEFPLGVPSVALCHDMRLLVGGGIESVPLPGGVEVNALCSAVLVKEVHFDLVGSRAF